MLTPIPLPQITLILGENRTYAEAVGDALIEVAPDAVAVNYLERFHDAAEALLFGYPGDSLSDSGKFEVAGLAAKLCTISINMNGISGDFRNFLRRHEPDFELNSQVIIENIPVAYQSSIIALFGERFQTRNTLVLNLDEANLLLAFPTTPKIIQYPSLVDAKLPIQEILLAPIYRHFGMSSTGGIPAEGNSATS